MNSLAQQIIARREAKKWTQQQLASAADVSVGSVSRVERGETSSGPAIKAIMRALGIKSAIESPEHFAARIDDFRITLGGDVKSDPALNAAIDKLIKARQHESRLGDIESPSHAVEIPEWDSEVAAGEWIDCVTGQLDFDNDGHTIRRGRFILRIRGDSMEPIYRSGDRVLFRIVRLDEESLRIGADYVFCTSENACTLKRLQSIDDDGYTLSPLNKRYGPLRLTRQMLSRIAIVETIVRAPWEV